MRSPDAAISFLPCQLSFSSALFLPGKVICLSDTRDHHRFSCLLNYIEQQTREKDTDIEYFV